jgi:outer membrane autotransporter protein
VGISLGWEDVDLDTQFNMGTLDGDGFSITPYAAFMATQNIVLDLMFSYADLDYDTTRANGTIFGGYDADRWMVSGGMSYYWTKDKWNVVGRLGLLYSEEDADGYTEVNGVQVAGRDTDLGELRIGGKVGYNFGKVEPYLGVHWLWDFTMEDIVVAANQAQPANDSDELEVSLGVNCYAIENFTAGVEVSHGFLREDYDNTSVLLNLRYSF